MSIRNKPPNVRKFLMTNLTLVWWKEHAPYPLVTIKRLTSNYVPEAWHGIEPHKVSMGRVWQRAG